MSFSLKETLISATLATIICGLGAKASVELSEKNNALNEAWKLATCKTWASQNEAHIRQALSENMRTEMDDLMQKGAMDQDDLPYRFDPHIQTPEGESYACAAKKSVASDDLEIWVEPYSAIYR